jgi:hypothetical protein
MQTHLSEDSVCNDKGLLLSSWYRRGGHLCTLHKGNVCPAFWQKRGGQRTHLASDFQLLSAQNNLYARVANWEVAYSGTLQYEHPDIKPWWVSWHASSVSSFAYEVGHSLTLPRLFHILKGQGWISVPENSPMALGEKGLMRKTASVRPLRVHSAGEDVSPQTSGDHPILTALVWVPRLVIL